MEGYTYKEINIPKSKSRLKIGKERNIIIELDTRFNKLQRKMWKYLLNIDIENLDTKDNNKK